MDFKGIDFFLVEGFEPQTLNCIIIYSAGTGTTGFSQSFWKSSFKMAEDQSKNLKESRFFRENMSDTLLTLLAPNKKEYIIIISVEMR